MIGKICILSAAALLFAGCSSKAPDPVRLDGGSSVTINQNLLLRKDRVVPQDPFLKENNWTYNIHAKKQAGGELLASDQVVKTFLLAHNATKIIIVGSEAIGLEYKNFFISNGVTADIELQPVSSLDLQKDLVNILFFRNKEKIAK